MDVRRLGEEGAALLGRLLGCNGTRLFLDASAPSHLAFADESYAEFTRAIDDFVRETAMKAPESSVETKPSTTAAPGDPVLELDLRSANITSVIWCTGYGFGFEWVGLPILDDRGTPVQHRGVTSVPGAYFLGLHWMHKFNRERSGLSARMRRMWPSTCSLRSNAHATTCERRFWNVGFKLLAFGRNRR